MKLATLLLAATLTPLWAQEIKLPANLEKLAAAADESVSVTLDGPLLQLAARFLSDQDRHEAKVKKLVAGLQGIYVRSLHLGSSGEYTQADVDSVRAQFQGPGWSRIADVRSREHDNVDVFLKTSGDSQLAGIGVIATNPTEITIVNIKGTLEISQLVELGGEFNIPRLQVHAGSSRTKELR